MYSFLANSPMVSQIILKRGTVLSLMKNNTARSILVLLLLLGCASPIKPPLLAAAQKLIIGMAKTEVEERIGRPVQDLGIEAFYGKPLTYEDWESPYIPFELTVYYRDGRVADIAYYDRKHFYRASGVEP